MLKAVLFDMDGVIVDSEPLHHKAYEKMFEEFDITVSTELYASFTGKATLSICEQICNEFNLETSPELLVASKRKHFIPLFENDTDFCLLEGVLELIKNYHQNGITLIVASSASMENINRIFKRFDLDQYFNTRLPRDHVKKDSDYFATHSLWNLIKHKKILSAVEKILGPEILSNPVQNTRIKQPEKTLPKKSIFDGLSGRTPWHQDAAVLSTKGQKNTELLTVWIPFTKTTKKNGCMITIPGINKLGLLNHHSGYKGQVEIKNSDLLNSKKVVYLEADVGDIVLLHRYSPHCSIPNKSNSFRISADLRYNKAGQTSGREPLPSFYVKSKNKKNITILNFKQWLALWEKAKEKCIPRKYAFKYPLPTYKNSKRDLSKLI